MATQSADLHRSLLRPMVINTLRGTGFHSTKPSVLDALVNIAERHLLLLATSTAQHAQTAHNDHIPSIADVRHALTECGVLVPYADATEEEFRERMRRPLSDYVDMKGGHVRLAAERRRRDEQDVKDIRDFTSWFDGAQYTEIRRVAGMSGDAIAAGPGSVGVGGSLVRADDMLVTLKKKYGKTGQESEARFADTVLGQGEVDRPEVVIEGGAARSLQLWALGTAYREMNGVQKTDMDIDEQQDGHATSETALDVNNNAMITT
ncbi:hypothetical protein AMS68_002992 [Peltaster fructicola]|uniref:Bromodomain associated domain-containing protein n=1 Tax=Peltaster fructicola TaxID=286661 RepID=A0A6H0XS63_9PEZI|nr:hypothetical protein AMS68_002992 [Peltaster fructicola]